MGAWGTRLYQDDVAEDVKTYYKEQLGKGRSGEEITAEMIELNSAEIEDPEDGPVFWFALADTQWNLGRLEDHVKERALYHIDEGSDLKRWEDDPKEMRTRAEVLGKLKEKLLSPQPEKKKVSVRKNYRCQWQVGDVYAYQLSGDYAKENGVLNKYLFFVKIGEDICYPEHIVPVVYFYRGVSDKILTLEELQEKKYIPQFYNPVVYERYPNTPVKYMLTLCSTSSRVIPKKQLTFLGNIGEINHMPNEDPQPFGTLWKFFEEYIIDNFKKWGEI